MYLLILFLRVDDSALTKRQIGNPLPLHRMIRLHLKSRLPVKALQNTFRRFRHPDIFQFMFSRKNLHDRQKLAAFYIRLHLPENISFKFW